MLEKTVYAKNTVSGMVVQISEDTLTHPTLGKSYVRVEAPDTCIDCGVQPEVVVEVESVEDEAPPSAPKRSTTKEK